EVSNDTANESPSPANNAEVGNQEQQGTESAPSDNPDTRGPVADAGSRFNPTVSVTLFDSRGRLSEKTDMPAQEAAVALRGRIAVLKMLKGCIHA
ncbi:MAG: hypothetical protein EBT13_18270, partial [Rhodobacteraceae bacterium]|nr:hypothetical protein [Paracoccaceae bacterium]